MTGDGSSISPLFLESFTRSVQSKQRLVQRCKPLGLAGAAAGDRLIAEWLLTTVEGSLNRAPGADCTQHGLLPGCAEYVAIPVHDSASMLSSMFACISCGSIALSSAVSLARGQHCIATGVC